MWVLLISICEAFAIAIGGYEYRSERGGVSETQSAEPRIGPQTTVTRST